VDVADEFEQISIVLNEDGFEPVLKEVAAAMTAPIEGGCVAGEQALHDAGDGCGTGSGQEMHVVGHQAPGVNRPSGSGDLRLEAVEEVAAIEIGAKDASALDAPSDDVLENTGAVEPWSTGHPWMLPPGRS